MKTYGKIIIIIIIILSSLILFKFVNIISSILFFILAMIYFIFTLRYESKYELNYENITIHKGGKKTIQFVEYKPGERSFKCNKDKLWGSSYVEADFITDILYDYNIISSSMNNLVHSDVLALTTNIFYIKEMEKAIDKVQPSVLLLLSDEWETRPEYEKIFSKVPIVYIQYRYNSYKNPINQHILPTGHHCWDSIPGLKPELKPELKPKKYSWSFIGNNKGNRKKNLNKLDTIKPNFHGTTKP